METLSRAGKDSRFRHIWYLSVRALDFINLKPMLLLGDNSYFLLIPA